MSSEYDATEFVDGDFQERKAPVSAAGAGSSSGTNPSQPAPTREELDAELARTQEKLAAILREKEEKERERAALEEARRRHVEFQTGRQELLHNLTRGVGLLEEAEFNARRDAEQMVKTLADLRAALDKIQAVHEESWTKDNFNVELTRALTILENARMEWNAARLKFPILSGETPEKPQTETAPAPAVSPFASLNFVELCKIGLALNWPLVLVALGAIGVLASIWLSMPTGR